MKFLLLSTLATIGVFLAFAVGLFTQQNVLMMGGFCAWTPAIFIMGIAVAKAGRLRSPIVFNDEPAQYSTSTLTPIAPRQSRLANIKKEA